MPIMYHGELTTPIQHELLQCWPSRLFCTYTRKYTLKYIWSTHWRIWYLLTHNNSLKCWLRSYELQCNAFDWSTPIALTLAVISYDGLQVEEPQTALPLSITWKSHIATSMLMGHQTLPNQFQLIIALEACHLEWLNFMKLHLLCNVGREALMSIFHVHHM